MLCIYNKFRLNFFVTKLYILTKLQILLWNVLFDENANFILLLNSFCFLQFAD